MESRISLIIIKDPTSTQQEDVSELVETITWKGRKGSAARSITVTLIDDGGYKHPRSGIDVEEGHQCIFSWDGEELFRGIIMSTTQTQKKLLKFTAYDIGIYLSNNKDSFCYENKTANEIFSDVCTRFGLPMGEVSACSYKIPDLTKSKTTAFDAISDALSLDYDATGVRHYVTCANGKLNLITRRQNILQWVIEVGENMSTYEYTKSIEDVRTRVKMVSSEGTVVAEKSNEALESKYGIMQDIQVPDESLTEAQVNDLIDSILKEKSTPSRSLSVSALGIADVIAGIGVYIIIPDLDISETYYVDQDSHTFEGNNHTMDLTLTRATDLDVAAETAASTEEGGTKQYAVGDIVTFNGGYHYNSSNDTSPVGGNRKAGQAKITLTAAGARHPWHLIGGAYNECEGDCNVYGWVDDGSFT